MSKEFKDIYISEEVDPKEYDYEGDMAKTQLVTIADAAEELHDLLEDDENLPEWCQNKISKAMDYLDTVRDYMISKDTEEEPGDENPNEAVVYEDTDVTELKKSTLASYIKKASDDRAKNAYDIGKSGKINYKGLKRRQGINRAVNKMANESVNENYKVGDTVKPTKGPHAGHPHEVIHDHGDGHYNIAPVGLAPSSIKYRLGAAKAHKKDLRKEETQNEGNMASAAKELEAYARKSGGIDKNDFIKAVIMMKKNQKKQLDKFVDELDTEPREKILSVMQKHIKEAYNEPQGQAKRMMSPLQKMRMDKEKKDRDRDGKLKPGVVRRGRSTMNRLRDIQNKSNAMALKSSKEQVEEGAMKRIAQAKGGTKPDKSDAAVNKGGLQTFKKKPTNEKLKVSDGMGAWIDDFKQSDAPQFKGKNAKERRDMAISAYLSAKDGEKNEDI